MILKAIYEKKKLIFFVSDRTADKHFLSILYSRELRFFLIDRYIHSPSDEGKEFSN